MVGYPRGEGAPLLQLIPCGAAGGAVHSPALSARPVWVRGLLRLWTET